MAKVKCEFCGNFIDDTCATCPNCGGVNENHQRVAKGTPRTIEELKTWYKTRGLPPEEVTRFFIGKNIKAPKVFGIYEENGKFVVYKNKSDGSRAIRYEGTDEAYAVNELYLRLKEEILNQKSMNIAKRGIGNRPGFSVSDTSGKSNRRRNKKISFLVIIFLLLFLPSIIISMVSTISLGAYLGRERGYYISDTNEVYYSDGRKYDGKYEWWFYDQADDEWELYAKYDRAKQKPESLKKDSYDCFDLYSDVTDCLSIESEKFPIGSAKEYIDAGHHENPRSSYYYYNDDLYYFLDDEHSDYGSTDNTGWYVYDTDISDWTYYCGADEKDVIGDDLWYNESDFSAGSSFDDMYAADEYLATWTPSSFEDTSWYHSYESNESAYDRHLQEDDDDSYDSDNDYDWDSNDSWDSGDTDWDSDW